MDKRSQEPALALPAAVPESQQPRLMQATRQPQAPPGDAARAPPQLRPLRSGDLGWVVSRHGALYAQEYGWDMRFEALVARIAADFIDQFDVRRDAAWIAERAGMPLGCVFLVQARHERTAKPLLGVAQLRLLLVEPSARGQGLGKLLTAECERFATAAGYKRIKLWTNSVLLAARAIYEAAGYRLLSSEPHRSFGGTQVGEVWEKELAGEA